MSKKKKFQPEDQPSKSSFQSGETREELSKRLLAFDVKFLEDLSHWVKADQKIALRLLALVEEIRRTPFEGTGKPERLKYQDGNVWSRRLTEKDRIVYLVTDDRIEFLQGRYHYSDR